MTHPRRRRDARDAHKPPAQRAQAARGTRASGPRGAPTRTERRRGGLRQHIRRLPPPPLCGHRSNWALPIDTPPYVGFPVTCGITFTFGGVRVDEDARVLDTLGRVIPGLTAAGELVAGLFFHNYPGGTGLTAGAVFRRRAGYAAADWAAGR